MTRMVIDGGGIMGKKKPIFQFVVNGRPAPKPRMTQSDRWKQRPCVLRYREYADAIRAAAIDAKRTHALPDDFLFDGNVEVEALFGKDYTLIKVSEISGEVQIKKSRGDIDNYGKSVAEGLFAQQSGMESLLKILIHDDKQIIHMDLTFAMENGDALRIK